MAKQILAQITSFVGTDDKGLTKVHTQIGFGEASDAAIGTRNVTEAFAVIDDADDETEAKNIATLKALSYFIEQQEQSIAMNGGGVKIDIALQNDIAIKATTIFFAAKDKTCTNVLDYLTQKNMLTYANSDEYKAAYERLFTTLRNCDTILPLLHFTKARSLFNWHFEPADKSGIKNLPKDGAKVQILNGVIVGTNLKCFDYTFLGNGVPVEGIVSVKTVKAGTRSKIVVSMPRTLTIINSDNSETEVTASEANKRLAAGEQLVGKTGAHCKLIARLSLNLEIATTILQAKGFTPRFLGFDLSKPAIRTTFTLD